MASGGIRDLRNNTSELVERVQVEGEIIIKSHGKPVAVLRPFQEAWKVEALRLLHSRTEPVDGGLAELLADDDMASMDDLD